MPAAYGGMSRGTTSTSKKKDSGEDKGIFGGYDPISVAWDVGKKIVGSATKDRPSPSKPAAKPSGSNGGNGSYPGVSAAARAQSQKAQSQADAYAKYQRKANQLKRKIKANSGPTDLAGRTQRAMDLKRMRGIQKEADRRKKLAQDAGLRMGGGSGGRAAGSAPSSGGSRPASGGGGGGGGTAAGNAVAKASSGGGAAAAGKKQSNAPKVGAVLSRARKMKKETTGTPITAKELKNFMAYYDKTHKGTLSRSDAVLMARMLKSKSPKVAKRYGLNVSLEG